MSCTVLLIIFYNINKFTFLKDHSREFAENWTPLNSKSPKIKQSRIVAARKFCRKRKIENMEENLFAKFEIICPQMAIIVLELDSFCFSQKIALNCTFSREPIFWSSIFS